VCVAALVVSLIAVVHADGSHRSSAGAVAGDPAAVARQPFVLYRASNLDRSFGQLAVTPLGDHHGSTALTSLTCDRVDMAGGHGVCLVRRANGLLSSTSAVLFGTDFRPGPSIALEGYPSRVRVSPDGRLGSTTTFVSGDSYAQLGFSTRTVLLDLVNGTALFDLAKLDVRRDGRPFRHVDDNFWGVTFAPDGRTFYATLGTGGKTYLIKADVQTRQAQVLRSGVECPSLSPDGTRIAFKQRVPGNAVAWRLAVLDLATLTDHPVAEDRHIDDQAAWLDDHTLLYGLPRADGDGSLGTPAALAAGSSIATDTYTVPADGTGAPALFLRGAWSADVVRPAGQADAR
jgi:hypothetical protein